MKISKNNIVYIGVIIIIYILLNFLLGFRNTDLVIMTSIELILIVIAISPIGEVILRFIYGVKSVKTNKDKEYLLPLFNEVYETVRRNENYNNTKIKLYIDKSMTVNAYAMGTRTIAITRGSIETLTSDQIKGLFAHELRTYNTL